MPETKERPILFSAPMVRAILEGRKTVTRRVVKAQPFDLSWSRRDHKFEYTCGRAESGDEVDGFHAYTTRSGGQWSAKCPYGQPGDQLWVRETWGVISHDFDEHGNMVDWVPDRPASPVREMRFGQGYYSGHVIYRADGEADWAGDDDGGGDDRSAWKPSIHMPRIASRILREITDVRVERLQDISGDQAQAEGVDAVMCQQYLETSPSRFDCKEAVIHGFAGLWQSTGGDWAANPWFWVVEFKRVQPES
jgi:hypothetical protein